MTRDKREASSGRDEISSIEKKIESGVKKRQAVSETLDPKLAVPTGSATSKSKGRR